MLAKSKMLALVVLRRRCRVGQRDPHGRASACRRRTAERIRSRRHADSRSGSRATPRCCARRSSSRAATPAEAFENSGFFLFPEDERRGVTYDVDRDKQLVRMTHGAVTRTAKFYGDQGCIIHPQDHDGIFFTPVPVKTRLPDAASQPWPMGDAPSTEPAPAGIDRARIAESGRPRVLRSRRR